MSVLRTPDPPKRVFEQFFSCIIVIVFVWDFRKTYWIDFVHTFTKPLFYLVQSRCMKIIFLVWIINPHFGWKSPTIPLERYPAASPAWLLVLLKYTCEKLWPAPGTVCYNYIITYYDDDVLLKYPKPMLNICEWLWLGLDHMRNLGFL